VLHILLLAAVITPNCKPITKVNDIVRGEFDTFNQQWFGNAITHTRIVACRNQVTLPDALGDTIPPHKWGNDSDDYIIEVSLAANPDLRQFDMTLIHEMVHVWLYETDPEYDGGHEGKFQHKMRMLALEGAFDDLW
jgi:hypothetical protein